MNKRTLSETDIRSKFITPALCGPEGAGWDLMTQVREEAYFTKGRVIVRGKTVGRGEAKKADYLLYYKPNIPIAVIEAKDNNHAVGDGMQQALEYAEILDVPFAYSSNGDAFLEHDRTGTGGTVDARDSARSVPDARRALVTLLRRQGLHRRSRIVVTTQDYYDDGSRQVATLLPAHRHQPHRRCDRPRREPHPPGHGHRHREDLHGFPDHLATLESQEPRSASSSSWIGTFSPTRRRPTTSSRSARR